MPPKRSACPRSRGQGTSGMGVSLARACVGLSANHEIACTPSFVAQPNVRWSGPLHTAAFIEPRLSVVSFRFAPSLFTSFDGGSNNEQENEFPIGVDGCHAPLPAIDDHVQANSGSSRFRLRARRAIAAANHQSPWTPANAVTPDGNSSVN